jgi:hypothetical protein
LSEDLFGHPILLHSLQVTQPTYPFPFIHFTVFSSLFNSSSSRFVLIFHFHFHLFPFICRSTFSSKYFSLKNKQSLFFFLCHSRNICNVETLGKPDCRIIKLILNEMGYKSVKCFGLPQMTAPREDENELLRPL